MKSGHTTRPGPPRQHRQVFGETAQIKGIEHPPGIFPGLDGCAGHLRIGIVAAPETALLVGDELVLRSGRIAIRETAFVHVVRPAGIRSPPFAFRWRAFLRPLPEVDFDSVDERFPRYFAGDPERDLRETSGRLVFLDLAVALHADLEGSPLEGIVAEESRRKLGASGSGAQVHLRPLGHLRQRRLPVFRLALCARGSRRFNGLGGGELRRQSTPDGLLHVIRQRCWRLAERLLGIAQDLHPFEMAEVGIGVRVQIHEKVPDLPPDEPHLRIRRGHGLPAESGQTVEQGRVALRALDRVREFRRRVVDNAVNPLRPGAEAAQETVEGDVVLRFAGDLEERFLPEAAPDVHLGNRRHRRLDVTVRAAYQQKLGKGMTR